MTGQRKAKPVRALADSVDRVVRALESKGVLIEDDRVRWRRSVCADRQFCTRLCTPEHFF
jgi:hypothetical protein